jgi:hypothetical protein
VKINLADHSIARLKCFNGLLGVIVDIDDNLISDEVECFYGVSIGESVQWFWESELASVSD